MVWFGPYGGLLGLSVYVGTLAFSATLLVRSSRSIQRNQEFQRIASRECRKVNKFMRPAYSN